MNEFLEYLKPRSNSPSLIVIELHEATFNLCGLQKLEEGKWLPSDEPGWMKRVEPTVGRNGVRHAHVAKERDIRNKNKQVAWNDDRSQHDKKSFNKNLPGIETAREIARKALGLPDDTVLEHKELNKSAYLPLLLESSDTTEILRTDPIIFVVRSVGK